MSLSSSNEEPGQSWLDLGLARTRRKVAQGRNVSLPDDLRQFCDFGTPTQESGTTYPDGQGRPTTVATFLNEFWTARQRQANSLHEISYRACFKPQLPRFFVERLTQPGDVVYDPFMGRGTTLLEAALLGRVPWGNDINPLSAFLIRPRLRPPTLKEIEARLREIPLDQPADEPPDLLAFYHPETLREVSSLKRHLSAARAGQALTRVDDWIAAVALNRLTGHSNGFFSVYTLPPNQAVSAKSQRRINERRNQTPPRRDVRKLILKKSKQLLSDVDAETRDTLAAASGRALLLSCPANETSKIPSGSVGLVVTSPPFLNVVQYAADNWLRCWFLGIDPSSVRLTVPGKIAQWQEAMTGVFRELHRVVKPGGHIAFEVGEVHGGMTKLEEAVLPCGIAAGLQPVLVLINAQEFTKTANCWGVDNMAKGTNTNRVVVFRKGS
jgi:hypothetical protein